MSCSLSPMVDFYPFIGSGTESRKRKLINDRDPTPFNFILLFNCGESRRGESKGGDDTEPGVSCPDLWRATTRDGIVARYHASRANVSIEFVPRTAQTNRRRALYRAIDRARIDFDFRHPLRDADSFPSFSSARRNELFQLCSSQWPGGEEENEMEGERRRREEGTNEKKRDGEWKGGEGEQRGKRERERETVAYNVFVSRGKKGKRRASKWFVMTRKTVKPNRVAKIQPLGATTRSSGRGSGSRFVEKLWNGTVRAERTSSNFSLAPISSSSFESVVPNSRPNHTDAALRLSSIDHSFDRI